MFEISLPYISKFSLSSIFFLCLFIILFISTSLKKQFSFFKEPLNQRVQIIHLQLEQSSFRCKNAADNFLISSSVIRFLSHLLGPTRVRNHSCSDLFNIIAKSLLIPLIKKHFQAWLNTVEPTLHCNTINTNKVTLT